MAITLDQISLFRMGNLKKLEFKKTTGSRRETAKTLCAILKQQGGLILFGVSPNGEMVGQKIG